PATPAPGRASAPRMSHRTTRARARGSPPAPDGSHRSCRFAPVPGARCRVPGRDRGPSANRIAGIRAWHLAPGTALAYHIGVTPLWQQREGTETSAFKGTRLSRAEFLRGMRCRMWWTIIGLPALALGALSGCGWSYGARARDGRTEVRFCFF